MIILHKPAQLVFCLTDLPDASTSTSKYRVIDITIGQFLLIISVTKLVSLQGLRT